MNRFFLAFVVSLLLLLPIAGAAIEPWKCEMDARLGNPGTGAARPIRPLTGSGMATCHNVRGFEFDVPVKVSIETTGLSGPSRARLPQMQQGLLSMRAQSPFVIARDLDEIYDDFEPVRAGRSATSPDVQRILFRGRERHLFMELFVSGTVATEIGVLTISPD